MPGEGLCLLPRGAKTTGEGGCWASILGCKVSPGTAWLSLLCAWISYHDLELFFFKQRLFIFGCIRSGPQPVASQASLVGSGVVVKADLPCSTWDLVNTSLTRDGTCFPALKGGFSTTAPPGLSPA